MFIKSEATSTYTQSHCSMGVTTDDYLFVPPPPPLPPLKIDNPLWLRPCIAEEDCKKSKKKKKRKKEIINCCCVIGEWRKLMGGGGKKTWQWNLSFGKIHTTPYVFSVMSVLIISFLKNNDGYKVYMDLWAWYCYIYSHHYVVQVDKQNIFWPSLLPVHSNYVRNLKIAKKWLCKNDIKLKLDGYGWYSKFEVNRPVYWHIKIYLNVSPLKM